MAEGCRCGGKATVLTPSHALSPSMTTFLGGWFSHPHFPDEETEAPGVSKTCLELQRGCGVESASTCTLPLVHCGSFRGHDRVTSVSSSVFTVLLLEGISNPAISLQHPWPQWLLSARGQWPANQSLLSPLLPTPTEREQTEGWHCLAPHPSEAFHHN